MHSLNEWKCGRTVALVERPFCVKQFDTDPGDSWRGNTREPYWTAQARRSDLAGFFAPMGNPEILHSLYSA